MFRRLSLLICGVILVNLLALSSAFSQELVYRNYNVNDGLPSSQVYMALQDKYGYMWFCTDRGVTRFNGYDFETFPTNNGVGQNAVFRIQEDDLGRVWYSVFDKRWFYFENEQFVEYPYNSIIDSCIGIRYPIGFHMDSAQTVWFSYGGPYNAIIHSIDSVGNVQEYNANELKEIPEFRTMHLDFPQQTYHPVSSTVNTAAVQKEKRALNALLIKRDYTEADFKSKYFRRYCFYNNEVQCYDPKKGYSSFPIGYIGGKRMFVDRSQNFWMCDPLLGAFCFINGDLDSEPIRYLEQTGTTSTFEDQEGGMWFMTLYNGVYYLPNKESKVYTQEMGLPNNYITSILKRNDTLFCGHSLGQLSQLTPEKGKYKVDHVYKEFKHVYNLEYTNGDKVVVLSAVESTDLPPNFESSAHRSYFNQNDTTYSFDHRGELYITDSNHDTINRINTVPRGERSLSYSSKLGLLIGTIFGLYYLKKDTFIPLSTIHPDFGERVQKIISFPTGWHAICTLGKGLIFWNEEKIYNLNTKDGLNSNLCNNIYLENDSTLWVCSNIGINKVIYRSSPNRLKVTESFTVENGLLSNEVNALFVDSTGLWAATRGGLNYLSFSSLKKNTYEPPVYISKKTANSRAIENNEKLHHSTNTIQIGFVGLSYKWTGNLKYRYRLLGSRDETWQMTEQTNLTFSSVNPGTYTFEVEAINSSGISSQKPAQFTFTILTPFWRTNWFYITAFVILTLILLFINYFNISRIKKRAKLLNELADYKNKSLRSQMNPHFIYNSLNTVQSFILKNDTDQSMSYLSKFSRLMRMTFKNSSDNLVSLKDDLIALQLYTDLESIRYPKKIKVYYTIDVKEPHLTLIPPLLIQPFVENAIIHGVLPKEEKGNVSIAIRLIEGELQIEIKDDGVGFDSSKQIQIRKNWNQTTISSESGGQKPVRESGITVTSARIKLHNELNKNIDTDFNIQPNSENAGTLVSFKLAAINSFSISIDKI